MSLIDCPECQRKISDQAQSCPQCGYPLAQRHRPDFEFPFQKPLNELADQLAERLSSAIHEFMRPPAGAHKRNDENSRTDKGKDEENPSDYPDKEPKPPQS